jgi:hypothetical protein
MPSGPRLLVLGMMGRTPVAGVAWQVLHYLEGFRRLGCDVHYVEDTGDWPYDPDQDTISEDCRYTVQYIARLMAWCGLSDRWAYRAAAQGGKVYGLSESRLAEIFATSDALVNVTGATLLREEHLRVPVRIFLETDPFAPQIEVAQGRRFTIDLLAGHTHHFTFGENIGTPDCAIPVGRFAYQPTRQPIVPDWWLPPDGRLSPGPDAAFTTIASWKQTGKDIEWKGQIYRWSKHLEFLKLIDLPGRTDRAFELAITSADEDATDLLRSHGWRLRDGFALSLDTLRYRDYIWSSRGEVTVAKDQYVRPHTGWFSDRSACYLAAGRPVITQDTGFSTFLPAGKGLFAFNTIDDILAALETIHADYDGNCRAALEVAREHFAAEPILRRLLAHVGM